MGHENGKGKGERRKERGWGQDRPSDPPPLHGIVESTGPKREKFRENVPLIWAPPLPWAQKKGGGSTSPQAPRPNETRPPSGRSPPFGVEDHGGDHLSIHKGKPAPPIQGRPIGHFPPPFLRREEF